uniref:Putative lysophospholipase n=1 Tax=Amblyomma triste TaxID=251400 RepID=A0A023GBW4_AMBTT
MWFRTAVYRPIVVQLQRSLSTAVFRAGPKKMSWPDAPRDVASRDCFDIEDGTFTNSEGHMIVTKAWIPHISPSSWKALVFMCHGYVEHCHVPFYDILARIFVGQGCYVFSQDLVGHGRSQGVRASIKSFDKYMADILHHVDTTRQRFSDKPVYIFGHSMGGLLAAMAVQTRPADFAGLAMMSPFLAPNKDIAPSYKKIATRLLAKVAPTAPVGAVDVALISRDPQVVAYMTNDPLRHRGSIPLGWVAASLRAQTECRDKAKLIEVPMFVQVGTDDKICDVCAMKKFFEAVPSKEKTIKLYEGSYHNIFTEPDGIREQGYRDIAEWFRERLSSPREAALPPRHTEVDVGQASGHSQAS